MALKSFGNWIKGTLEMSTFSVLLSSLKDSSVTKHSDELTETAPLIAHWPVGLC